MFKEGFPGPEPEQAPAKPFSKRVKKLVSGALIAASMAAGVDMAPERAEAEERTGKKTTLEHKEVLEGTESSAWAVEMVRRAKTDFANVRNKSEAERWMRVHFKAMALEFYFPTRGRLETMNIGDASLKTRKYAKGDAKIVLQSIEEMREMVDQLNVRYRIYAYAEQSAQLSSMEEAAKRRTLQ